MMNFLERILRMPFHAQSHGAQTEPRNDLRMAHWRGGVFAEIRAHPADAIAAHDVVRVDHLLDAGDSCYVTAHHNLRLR